MSELIVLEKKNAMTIFGVEKGTESIIDQIRKKARSIVPDISTEKGREEIRSLAYQIARTKTALDETGKELTEDMKKTTKLVDAERKRVRDSLDALKEEVRKPLTDWEEAEKNRVKGHEDALISIEGYARLVESSEMGSAEIQEQINAAAAVHAGRDWQEFTMRAERTLEDVLNRLTAKRDAAKKREDEQAELERFRAKEAEDLRIETERKSSLQTALGEIVHIGAVIKQGSTVEELQALIETLNPYAERDWQEYADQAKEALAGAEASIKNAIELETRRAADDETKRIKDEHEKQQKELADAETARVDAHNAAIKKMTEIGTISDSAPSGMIAERRVLLKASYERDFQEFQAEADGVYKAVDAELEAMHTSRVEFETEEKRKTDKAEEDRKADLLAKVSDISKLAKFEEPEPTAEQVEARMMKAVSLENFKWQEFQNAAKSALEDVIATLKKELSMANDRAEQKARSDNKAHRTKINNEILTALTALIGTGPTALEQDQIKELIGAIAKGEIPHTKISY